MNRALPGLFPPSSLTWRVNQERALLLGGGRALLMQLAHPLVAAGVAEHSDFRRRPLRRLLRTMELTLALVFGTRKDAWAAARAINRAHQPVHGEAGGTPYSAMDPDLLLWVHSTLVDSALVSYSEFVRPLEPAEREAYHLEAQVIGRMLGIPVAAFAPGVAAFDEYVDGMCARVEVSEDGRRLAEAVLRPPLPVVPGFAYAPLELVTAGLLPPRLRRAFGLPWSRRRAALYRGVRSSVRTLVAAAPEAVRLVPPARHARRRWQ